MGTAMLDAYATDDLLSAAAETEGSCMPEFRLCHRLTMMRPTATDW